MRTRLEAKKTLGQPADKSDAGKEKIQMKIKHWMTKNPISVSSDTLIIDAKKVMKENKIRRLPVVDKGKLVGIVTYRNIIEASPSAVTSLSIHELNYLYLKLKVSDIMHKKPITVSPEDSNFEVITKGHKIGIGSFPVVDKGKLVGIVTESEIFDALVHLFGQTDDSQLITLENIDLENKLGQFSRISTLIEKMGIPVLAIFSLPHRQQEGHRVFIRVKTKKTDPVKKMLVKEGFSLQK